MSSTSRITIGQRSSRATVPKVSGLSLNELSLSENLGLIYKLSCSLLSHLCFSNVCVLLGFEFLLELQAKKVNPTKSAHSRLELRWEAPCLGQFRQDSLCIHPRQGSPGQRSVD